MSLLYLGKSLILARYARRVFAFAHITNNEVFLSYVVKFIKAHMVNFRDLVFVNVVPQVVYDILVFYHALVFAMLIFNL